MRRTAWRGAAIGLAMVLLLAGAAHAALTVQAIGVVDGVGIVRAAPGAGSVGVTPDGALLRLFEGASPPVGIDRFDGDGHRTTTEFPAGLGSGAGLTPLVDGGIAFISAGIPRYVSPDVVRVSPSGRLAVLRVSSRKDDAGWNAEAIAPDGTLWRVLSCEGVISSTTPAGVERRLHLRRLGCRTAHDRLQVDTGTTLAFGPDGSVWVASLCQARIVRIGLVGPRREWHLRPQAACKRRDDYENPLTFSRGGEPSPGCSSGAARGRGPTARAPCR